MRLSGLQESALRQALEGTVGSAWLFGSRVDANARGGDIDLLLLTHEEPVSVIRRVTRKFFSLCEEKLDVVVMYPDRLTPEQSAFLGYIRKERIA